MFYNVMLLLLNTVPEEGEVGSTAFLRVSLPQFDRLGPLIADNGTTAEFLFLVEATVMTKVYVLTRLACTHASQIVVYYRLTIIGSCQTIDSCTNCIFTLIFLPVMCTSVLVSTTVHSF